MHTLTAKEINDPRVRVFSAEGCDDLAVLVLPADAEHPKRCVSYWVPTDDEKAAIMRGEPILLSIYGGQPPVALYVQGVEYPTV